jgi:hypothetical protein
LSRNWDSAGVVCAILGISEPESYILDTCGADGFVRGAGRANCQGGANRRELSDCLGGAGSFGATGRRPASCAAIADYAVYRAGRRSTSEQLSFFEIPLSTSPAGPSFLIRFEERKEGVNHAPFMEAFISIFIS